MQTNPSLNEAVRKNKQNHRKRKLSFGELSTEKSLPSSMIFEDEGRNLIFLAFHRNSTLFAIFQQYRGQFLLDHVNCDKKENEKQTGHLSSVTLNLENRESKLSDDFTFVFFTTFDESLSRDTFFLFHFFHSCVTPEFIWRTLWNRRLFIAPKSSKVISLSPNRCPYSSCLLFTQLEAFCAWWRSTVKFFLKLPWWFTSEMCVVLNFKVSTIPERKWGNLIRL